MFRKFIFCIMACLHLAGSVILPLGDFSLLRDIPDMYGKYAKVTTPEEFSVVDFIGDYLLNGKELFGHNKFDKYQGSAGDVQFLHHANPLNIVLTSGESLLPSVNHQGNRMDSIFFRQFLASGYRNGPLRPPLV